MDPKDCHAVVHPGRDTLSAAVQSAPAGGMVYVKGGEYVWDQASILIHFRPEMKSGEWGPESTVTLFFEDRITIRSARDDPGPARCGTRPWINMYVEDRVKARLEAAKAGDFVVLTWPLVDPALDDGMCAFNIPLLPKP